MPRPSTSRPAPRVRHGIANTSAIAWWAGSSSPGTPSVNTTWSATPNVVREPVQRVRYGPAADDHQRGAVHPLRGSRAAPGSACPGPCGAPAATRRRRPAARRGRSAARISARATSSGAKRSVSTPGGTCSSAACGPERRREPAAGVVADVGHHVGVVADAAQRRSRQRQHRPADLVAVGAGDDAAGARLAGQRRQQRQRRGGAEPDRVDVVLGDEPPHPRRHRRFGHHQRRRVAHHLDSRSPGPRRR